MIESTYLGLQHMSVRKGGQGGAIINVASFIGTAPTNIYSSKCADKLAVKKKGPCVGLSRYWK